MSAENKYWLVREAPNALRNTETFSIGGGWQVLTSTPTIAESATLAPDGTYVKSFTNLSNSVGIVRANINSTGFCALDVYVKALSPHPSTLSIRLGLGSSNNVTSQLVSSQWVRISINSLAGATTGDALEFRLFEGAIALWHPRCVRSGALETPYHPTTNSPTITENYVQLDPEFDFLDETEKLENEHLMIDGKRYVYKWGTKTRQKFTTRFINSQDMYRINNWWSSLDNLRFVGPDSSIFSCYIVNTKTPMAFNMSGIDDLWEGELELESF